MHSTPGRYADANLWQGRKHREAAYKELWQLSVTCTIALGLSWRGREDESRPSAPSPPRFFHEGKLDEAAWKLNERPRVTLNYQTLAQSFEECVASLLNQQPREDVP